jgi:type IV pilus assembly protein PilB
MNDDTKVQKGIKDINQAFKERDYQAKAKQAGIPYVNLINVPINSDLALIVPEAMARGAQLAVFFKNGNKLRVAVTDTENIKTKGLIQALQEKKYEVFLNICSPESIENAHRIYFRANRKKQTPIKNKVQETGIKTVEEEVHDLENLKNQIESANYDQALNIVQVGAYRTHSSDIHFQPEVGSVLVRFRIDGVLRPVFSLSQKIYEGIIKEVKHLSHLKLNVSIIPQDGQYSFKINERQINVRVSILPSHYGEACVMRLLDSEKNFLSFEELGYSGSGLEYIQEASGLPHGLVLITGPTGSGKTTVMYSLLQTIDTRAKKVITLEDPVEYNLEGITQSQVSPENGYDFSDGLRAILRQDPDVIMVGEIRDLETAETAAQASLTGHLVLATLHTNSAVESIPRMVNMGVKSFILAPALELIVAQRLVRKLCDGCVKARPITAKEQEHVQEALNSIAAKGIHFPALPAQLREAVGCQACGSTGYSGQTAITEVLRFDQGLKNLILQDRPMPEVYDYITKTSKMLTLHEDGILKAISGVTTLDEVYRVAA